MHCFLMENKISLISLSLKNTNPHIKAGFILKENLSSPIRAFIAVKYFFNGKSKN